MSGRARLAICAWVATLMASCAMLPLVSPATWIIQAAFMLNQSRPAWARRPGGCRWPGR